MSESNVRVKPILPAPIKASLNMETPLWKCQREYYTIL
jgi:hypothetical protein